MILFYTGGIYTTLTSFTTFEIGKLSASTSEDILSTSSDKWQMML